MKLKISKPFKSSGQGSTSRFACNITDQDSPDPEDKRPELVAVFWGKTPEMAVKRAQASFGPLLELQGIG